MANTATLKPRNTEAPTPAEPRNSSLVRSFAMLSHPGLVRRTNQDACAALPEYGAFVVCDGVGGAAAGEVASHLATEAFLHSLIRPAPGRASRQTASDPPPTPRTRLQKAVHAANQAVFQRAQKSRALHGMGTTLVGALWDDTPGATSTLWLSNVGDSRGYLLCQDRLHLLTDDHSLVEEQVRAGLLSRNQADSSPIRNIITRAIGTQPAVEPDITAHPVQPGDLFLLASDGLTRELNDTDIAEILNRHSSAPLEAACQALIAAANSRGGRDNITVLLLAFR